MYRKDTGRLLGPFVYPCHYILVQQKGSGVIFLVQVLVFFYDTVVSIKKSPALVLVILVAALTILQSCGDSRRDAETNQLVSEIAKFNDLSSGQHVGYLMQLTELYGRAGTIKKAIPILTTFLETHPHDPFQGFTTAMLAEVWELAGEPEIAKMYYQMSLNSAQEVKLKGVSIQFNTIQKLLRMESVPDRLVPLLERMLREYAKDIDHGLLNYQLGFLYEKTGDYNKSLGAFNAFLQDPGAQFDTASQEYRDVVERVQLYNMKRNWTKPTLQQLVNEIQAAVRAKNVDAIVSLKAPKGKFFSMSWLQEKTDFNSIIDFNIERFILSSRGISFENQLESYSNSQEAYLRSWGWSSYMPVWYLYFRKVDFPADPEFNGTWEWAGVYFGDTVLDSDLNKGL